MSKKIFSAQEWENVPSEKNNLDRTAHLSCCTSSSDLQSRVEEVISEIENRGIDIAPTYNEWVNLGFALADEFAEMGRGYFHKLSALHHDYEYTVADKQYNNCLNSKGSGITLSTFFYLASKAGIVFLDHQKSILPNIQNGKLEKWITDSADLPTLPESLYPSLPPFIQEVVNCSISIEDREIVLLGTIGCLSACFPNVCGLYDDHVVYPNLYLFLVADAGMGKGSLNLCRELIAPINNRLHEESKNLMIDYKSKLAEYQQNKKKCPDLIEPVPPPQKTLIIPANSSASSFMSLLSDNEGIGLLFETEGDTLSQTLKSEHGNYSDVLRKGFHHEAISMSRRKDREFVELQSPRFSVVLSGTPRQVQRLIPDEEDGLLSRFIYYFIPFRRGIRNVFENDCISKSKHVAFKQLGDRFLVMHDEFAKLGVVEIVVPRYNVLLFYAWLTKLNEECCEEIDNGMQGLVRRLGLIAYRMMMLFTIIRSLGESPPKIRSPDGNLLLECTEDDFFSALCISETLLYHSAYIYVKLSSNGAKKSLPVPESGVNARRYALFNILPESFDRATYDRIVEERKENASTASKWIEKFIEDGKLKRVEQGRYIKL